MINTVIFDIGNVLVDFDWGAYISKLFDEETYLIVKDALFGSKLWNEIDRGVMSRDELLEAFGKRAPGYEEQIRIAFDRVGDSVKQHEYAIPWIEELKSKGLKVLYLSNYSHHVTQCNPSVLSFTDHMDGGVFSCMVKLIKPDHRIYEALFKQYGLKPAECVFIDDNAANIAAANELGLNTIHFTGYDEAYAKLNSMIND